MWTYCGNRNLGIMIFLLQGWDIMFTIFILIWVILYIINMDLPYTNCHRWTWCLQMSWQYHSSGHQWPSHRIVKTNVIGYDIREHMKPVVQSDSKVCNALGVVLIWRSHLTSIKILIIKIRQSHDCLIPLMEICTHKNDCILNGAKVSLCCNSNIIHHTESAQRSWLLTDNHIICTDIFCEIHIPIFMVSASHGPQMSTRDTTSFTDS